MWTESFQNVASSSYNFIFCSTTSPRTTELSLAVSHACRSGESLDFAVSNIEPDSNCFSVSTDAAGVADACGLVLPKK